MSLDVGAGRIALGHTLDDQAETVLIALMRGGGLEAVSGIDPAQGRLVRPLIRVRRTDVESFCRAIGLRPRLDPTNRDPRLLRNAVRLEVIPAMEKATARDVKGPIARSSDLLRSDLDQIRPREFELLFAKSGGGELVLDVRELESMPRETAAFAVKVALQQQLSALLGLAGGRPGRRVSLPGGFTAVREREYIRISSPENP